MVFVGYGLVIPEAKYDDLAGVDLKGKIAVYVNSGGPVKAPGNVKSHYSSGAERWAALRRAGAVGIATIPGGRGPNGAAGADSRGRRGWPRAPGRPDGAMAGEEVEAEAALPNLRSLWRTKLCRKRRASR